MKTRAMIKRDLENSLAQTPPKSIAEIAKREAMLDMHEQLRNRISWARAALDAEDWAGAATQFQYAALLLEAIAGTEAGNAHP